MNRLFALLDRFANQVKGQFISAQWIVRFNLKRRRRKRSRVSWMRRVINNDFLVELLLIHDKRNVRLIL